MTARYPRQQITEAVTVRTYLDAGPYGDLWADEPGVSTLCDLEAKRQLVRTAAGDEVVSETVLRLAPETDPALDLEALFVPESLVSVRGRDSVVLSATPELLRGRMVYLEVVLGAPRAS